ncbi:hypothetical protein BV20DRAFT_974265 [Pilatotrama ljubarskyi]|nr:hypothetical protein BV20DRAFT_974265 [Pilatotrama ljubarskyi]
MPTSRPVISIRLPAVLFVSGCPVEGELELDFRGLQRDNIQEVHVKLRGSAKTEMSRNNSTRMNCIYLVRDDASVWARGTVYPPPGSDIIRLPFRLQLPPGLPPSFYYSARPATASVIYSLTAVGVRPGAFKSNRRIQQPLAVVQRDDVGANVREQLAALAVTGAEPPWRTEAKEKKMRRGMWGDYATVNVQWSIPNMSPLPLFVPIPFMIRIDTTSPPITRAKADAHPPDKPIFPPPPSSYSMLEFKLVQDLFLRAQWYTNTPSTDFNVFTLAPGVTADMDVAEKEWIWVEGEGSDSNDGLVQNPDAKGVWVQSATFRGTFQLSCPPTFVLDDIIVCGYHLALKVPFPGVGNDVKMVVPINVGSGINAPLVAARPGSSAPATAPPRVLDLPPLYWDADRRHWHDHRD